jgi:hypothetical protein
MGYSLNQLVQVGIAKLLSNYNDFWLLSALTERGFEEGDRNRNFAESVRWWRSVELPESICRLMSLGINGVLAEVMRQLPGGYLIECQPNRGRDILVRSPDGSRGAALDVKHVYDMTTGHYYSADIPLDREKLLKHRLTFPDDLLFQVVFFVQFLNADYPRGRWYGDKNCPARSSYLVVRDIRRQYGTVAKYIGPATWPEDPPMTVPLNWPPVGVPADVAVRWFQAVFCPTGHWCFEPETYLREAEIGAAVWSY